MNILILSYACEPGGASEYGVGWNVPTTMAKKYPEHDVYVVCRGMFRERIERDTTPNLHFLFYDIPKWMTYPNERKSKWGEQINYLIWQLMVRRFVRNVMKGNSDSKGIRFDVVHHLTYNQYRTPSPGFWMDIPFVMGPIGGAECIDRVFDRDIGGSTLSKEKLRRRGWDLRVFRWYNSRRNNRKLILCSSDVTYQRLLPCRGNSDMEKMPAIGFESLDACRERNDDDAFVMMYAGKMLDWKGIKLFLSAVQKMKSAAVGKKIKVQLIGVRFDDERVRVKGWVNKLGLEDNVELMPFVERSELLKMMANCDLFVYPAFRDSGSMSVLEACAMGRPSICFNVGGQDIFPDDILLKVPVCKTYEKCLDAFSSKLCWAFNNKNQIDEIGSAAKDWVEKNLTWDNKVEKFMEIYKKLCFSDK